MSEKTETVGFLQNWYHKALKVHAAGEVKTLPATEASRFVRREVAEYVEAKPERASAKPKAKAKPKAT